MYKWYDSLPLFLLAFVGGIVLFIVVFLLGARAVSIHYDKAGCHTYATQTGRETRFVNYTYWSWDCLVRSTDGKWISKDQLREFPTK